MKVNVQDCEAIEAPGSTIYILKSDTNESIGALRLKPNASLSQHNRPVEECLEQVEGTSVINLFENNKLIKRVALQSGETLKIPAYQYHEHTNQENTESLTNWCFDGDITKVIEQIRGSNGKN